MSLHGWSRRSRYIGLAVVALLALAACSSNSPASQSATTTALNGSPIKVMTVGAVNCSACLSLPSLFATAHLYQEWVNDHGGIAGHPLVVETCDDQGQPALTAACGRKAEADGDIAVVGSYDLNGAALVPVLQAEGIDDFGAPVALSPIEYTSRDVQIMEAFTDGIIPKAVADGCKKMAFLYYNLGSALDQFDEHSTMVAFESARALPLYKAAKIIFISASAQDLAPQVTQALRGGTDCLMDFTSPQLTLEIMTAYASLGAKTRIYSLVGVGLEGAAEKGFVKQTNGSIVYGNYSGLDTPAYADFRAALAKFRPSSATSFDSQDSLGDWAAYTGFTNVVKSMKGPINKTTFLHAAQNATVCTGGMLPCIDFAKPSVLGPDFRNENDYYETFFKVENGQDVPLYGGKFYDFEGTLTGAPLPAADMPPATPLQS